MSLFLRQVASLVRLFETGISEDVEYFDGPEYKVRGISADFWVHDVSFDASSIKHTEWLLALYVAVKRKFRHPSISLCYSLDSWKKEESKARGKGQRFLHFAFRVQLPDGRKIHITSNVKRVCKLSRQLLTENPLLACWPRVMCILREARHGLLELLKKEPMLLEKILRMVTESWAGLHMDLPKKGLSLL